MVGAVVEYLDDYGAGWLHRLGLTALDEPGITDSLANSAARVQRLAPVFDPLLRFPDDQYPTTGGRYTDLVAARLRGSLERLGLMERNGCAEVLTSAGRAFVVEIARAHRDGR